MEPLVFYLAGGLHGHYWSFYGEYLLYVQASNIFLNMSAPILTNPCFIFLSASPGFKLLKDQLSPLDCMFEFSYH